TALGAGARAGEHAPALDRVLGMSARATRGARVLLAAIVAAVWAAVVLGVLAVLLAGGFGISWLALALAVAPGLAGTGIITAYRRTPDWSKPLVITPQGAYPPDLFSAVALGPALALVTVLPAAVALVVGPAVVLVQIQVVLSAILVLVALHVRGVQKPGQPTGLMARAQAQAEQQQAKQPPRR
ncbi:MAG TPA: hypothetical protein DHV14_04570, partial [Micrococcales bacterium]|nr:hypothetical protein [Micrococcales bacterium]